VARPIVRALYDPYRVELMGYEIQKTDPAHYREAIRQLADEHPPPTDDELLKKKLLYLMANTKRRKEHAVAEHLQVAGLAHVSKQFPMKTVDEVVMTWYKRPGDEAIFTPSQAEFYRALEQADQPRALLLAQLQALIDGFNGD